jgi:o-succinylbenzoate---CoA ligase
VDWLERWAQDRPDAPFVITPDEVVDFRGAHERVAELVARIRASHVAGSRLGVIMLPTIEAVLLAIAVPLAEMVLVPLPAENRLLRAEMSTVARLHAVLRSDGRSIGHGNDEAPTGGDVHAIVFTSGSSGTPRGVRLTWGNIEAAAAASATHLDHRREDRWLAVLPLHHVAGLSILWRSAREGSAVVLAGGFEPTRVIALLEDKGVTLASFVSPMVERMIDHGLGAVPGFRFALVGGGPVSHRVMDASGIRLLPTYGMTETASQIATADPFSPRADRLVVLDGAAISLDPSDRITVDGPMVSPGDFGGPDRSAPLVTGDLGRFHGDRLEVLGRADSVIVTGGENVMPDRLERIIGDVPGVEAVAVVGLPDLRWGSIVVAAYTGSVELSLLNEAAGRLLAGHEVPRRWIHVTALPMLGIGKIDRAAVTALFD